MNRSQWRQRTDTATVNKRAAGRRKHNQRRQRAAAARRQAVSHAIHLGYELWSLEALAERFGVSKATMSRDLSLLGIDLFALRARYRAIDHTPPSIDDMQDWLMSAALVFSGYALQAQGVALRPEEHAAVDRAYAVLLEQGEAADSTLRALLGLGEGEPR